MHIKSLFTILLFSCLGCSSGEFEHNLFGRWNMKFRDGDDVVAVFRKDGTHDFFLNNKLFVSGKSSFKNDTLRAMDPICNPEYYSTYAIEFLAADSIRFTAVEDTCYPRKRDMNGAILVRAK